VFERWWSRARERFLSLSAAGDAEHIVFYYDPILDYAHPGSAQFGLYVALYLAPQRSDDAYRLFRWAAETYQWAGSGKIRQVRDPRVIPLGLVLAKEFGDRAVETRLREYVEASLEPHWDRSTGEFTWGFGLGEPVPRGQLNGVIMMAEVGEPGAWSRVFNGPNVTKFEDPTVVGVDYPSVGISQAWVDRRERRLALATYVADPARRGEPTRFSVTRLPTLAVRLTRDGRQFDRWTAKGLSAITVDTSVEDYAFVIEW
jgi:hypothetical protein